MNGKPRTMMMRAAFFLLTILAGTLTQAQEEHGPPTQKESVQSPTQKERGQSPTQKESAQALVALIQSVAKAQQAFDALPSKGNPESITAMQEVIAQKRKLLDLVIEQKTNASVRAGASAKPSLQAEEAIVQSECRSLARSIAWLAGVLEKQQEFEQSESEWSGLAKCCEKALGKDCPEYWDSTQEAAALGGLHKVSSDTKRKYFDNRRKIKEAVRRRDLAAALALAETDHQISTEIFGEKAPRTLSSLEYAAKIAFAVKDYQHSFEMFEKALTQRLEVYPGWHPTRNNSVLNLGNRYESLGDLKNAERTYRRIEPNAQQLTSLYRIATKWQNTAEQKEAERLLQEIFVVCGKTIGEKHPLRGLAGVRLGDLNRSLGDYEKALEHLHVCVDIWTANSNNLELANCLNSIALAQQLTGDLEAAATSYRKATSILDSSENAPPQGQGQNGQAQSEALRHAVEANYASLLEDLGQFPAALKTYERIVADTEENTVLSQADLAVRENLARLYQSVGELAKAEALLNELLRHQNRQPLEIARLHSSRGRFYLQMNALDRADQELDKALQVLSTLQPVPRNDQAVVNSMKALVLLRRGRLPESLATYENVLKELSEAFGPKHLRCAEIYDQVAKLQRKLGQYDASTGAHARAIEIYESAYGDSHAAVAWAYHRLGTTHFIFDFTNLANDAWQRSFEIKQRICNETLPWLPEAQAALFLTSLTTNDSSAGRDTLLSTLQHDQVENAQAALNCVWQSRGLVLNTIALREKQLANSEGHPQRQRLIQIRRRLAQLSLFTGNQEASQQNNTQQQVLRALAEEKEDLERTLAERAVQEVGSEQANSSLSDIMPEDLMQLLPSNTSVVQIVRTQRWQPGGTAAADVLKRTLYEAFVINKRDNAPKNGVEVSWITLGDAAEIDQHIEDWRSAIMKGGGGTRGRRIGKRNTPAKETKNNEFATRNLLHEIVWLPIASALVAKQKDNKPKVIIIPDGNLHRLPWAALPGANSDYLIEEMQISTATDGRQLTQLLQQARSREVSKEPKESYLLIGGVDYDAALPKPELGTKTLPRASAWPYLEGTDREIAAIKTVVPTGSSLIVLVK
ncbi:MAG: tetratricopeptide repeat protein [Planctomycetota bacterium]